MSTISEGAPRATYAIASAILKYLADNPNRTMSEIVKATGISRRQFSVTIGHLTDPDFVRCGYETRTTDRSVNFYIYNIDSERPLESMLRQLRQKLPD